MLKGYSHELLAIIPKFRGPLISLATAWDPQGAIDPCEELAPGPHYLAAN